MFSRRSTSTHCLNGDRLIGKIFSPVYFLFNAINNRWFQYHEKRCSIDIHKFIVKDLERFWDETDPVSSPSRKLSDLFWLDLPWPAITKALGQINFLDIGCGSGIYATRFARMSGVEFESYVGIDKYEHSHWGEITKLDGRIKFVNVAADKLSCDLIDQSNLIVSQSAIEHLERDLSLFLEVNRSIRNRKRACLNIHLFPTPQCLKLYRLHGVRQYTPRTVQKITDLFVEHSVSRLYEMGGIQCNNLHMEFITKPLRISNIDRRETERDKYKALLKSAIKKDQQLTAYQPSFFALMIYSYPKEDSDWNCCFP